jgi:hypothetical protein
VIGQTASEPPVNANAATSAAGAAVVVEPRASAGWPPLRAMLRRPHLAVGVALAVVIGIGLALRLHDIGVRSLWVDELFSVGLAAQDPRTILTVLYGEEANMTL